jgi:RHS repeat-associated protein
LQYDGFEHVIFWRNFKNGADWEDETYQYDRLDNIKTPFGAEVYDDATSRLLSWTDGTPTTWSYTYDAAGNLTQAVGGTVRLVYGYDALNQLRSLRRNGTLIARYGYDVLGQRIAKRVYSSASGGTVAYTRFVYHGSAVAYETDSAGTIGLRYTWGPGADNLIAVRDAAGNHYYVVHDPLGSVRGLVKRDGTWTMSVRYNPYGGVSRRDSSGSGPGFALRYGWTGREYDTELGWYYFRSRYYDPGAKRFVQEDPIGYGGGGNLYAYVGGDVMEARDPSGMLARYSSSLSDGPRFCFASCGDESGLYGSAYLADGVDAWGGSMISYWDGLTPAEQEWSYKEYRTAFYNRQDEGVYISAGETDPISSKEYGAVVSAIHNLESVLHPIVPDAATYAAGTLRGLLVSGRIAVNLAATAGGYAWADGHRGVLFINSNNFDVLIDHDARDRSFASTFLLAHEMGHFEQAGHGVPADNCRADIFARNATGLPITTIEGTTYCHTR